MKKTLWKDSIIEIKNTFKRFLSILLIVLLGVGFFAGIKAASPDMKKTLDTYFDEQDVMDLEIISTLGLTDEDILEFKNTEGVLNVAPSYSKDVIVNANEEEMVVKINSLTNNMNLPKMIDGRFPEKDNECIVEPNFLKENNYKLGDKIEINEKLGEDEDRFFKNTEYTIVGIADSPLYISRERGSSKLGAGKINYYMYVIDEAIDSDIYTECYITLKKTKEISTFSQKYENIVESVKDKFEGLSEERKEKRYKQVLDEANSKLEDAQKTFNKEKEKAEKELSDARKELEDAKEKVKKSEKEILSNQEKANTEFSNAQKQLENAQRDLKEKETAFNEGKKEVLYTIEQYKNTLKELNKNLSDVNYNIKDLENTKNDLNKTKETLQKTIEELKQLPNTPEIETQILEINNNINDIQKNIDIISENLKTLNVTQQTISQNITKIENGITLAETELNKNEKALLVGKAEIEKNENELQTNKNKTFSQLNNAKKQIEEAKKEISSNEKKLEEAEKVASEKILDAEKELDEAKSKIKDIKRPDWYILDRNMNAGYASYSQDTDRIANIGKVFPIVFFVVAALISLNTMTRMVEEQRTEIGTLKALGYNKLQIANKYLIYSSLATLTGGIIGMAIGFNFLPKIIFEMYSMMYILPPIITEFNITYALTGMIVALLCTVGAASIVCLTELNSTPATLMRPRAPKPGKRVFLEKLTFMWTKLKFSHKVTVRNIFRYKKRFLMTIIGILGCTALIVAGFALRDSISHMIPAQYGEVFKYQMQVSLKDTATSEDIRNEEDSLLQKEEIVDIAKLHLEAITVNDSTQDVQLVVPENTEKIIDFIRLGDRKTGELYKLENDKVIITEKLSYLLGIEKGDKITLKDTDNNLFNVTVSEITENYLFHYIYMSPQLYKNLFEKSAYFNIIYAKTENIDSTLEKNIAKEILENEEIASVSFTSATSEMFDEVMYNMSFVVWILIISAGLLAFVVLYNLSNVNISERIRELATIKVLGFYDKEVYKYVTRETILLTIIGIALGLLVGYFLNMYILVTCELDMFMFDKRVNATSFVFATIITLFFTIIVNIFTYFSLKKINMIESLKSVE